MNEASQNKTAYDLWHQRKAHEESTFNEIIYPWHRTVARLLPDLTGLKVLEVGCGRGDFSLWLGRKYPRADITGVDFSDAAVAVAVGKQPLAQSNVRFAVDDAENLKFSEASFDYVISCECLEHVPHPGQMAREIARVLKPAGKFILTTENYLNGMLLAWLNSWLRNQAFDSGSGAQPHENFFLWWRVKQLLEGGGLRIEHMESNHFQWFLLPRVAPHKLCSKDIASPFWKKVLRPFGRHFTYQGSKRS
jgi:2-polyprenyl-3-methyl-5-hydroxy-6-metoxy-1,4-benzoquinol methylase